jgi:hypothetical protein
VPVPNLPSFDEAVTSVLAIFGVSTSVIAMVALAFCLQSWVEAIRQILSGGRKARGLFAVMAHSLGSMRAVHTVLAVLVTVLVPIGQLFAIGLCFLGGNYISLALDSSRGEQVWAIIARERYHALEPDTLGQIVRVDLISGAYLVFAVVIVVRSYRLARSNNHVSSERLKSAAVMMAFPAVALLFLAGVAAIFLIAIVLFGTVISLVGGDTAGYLKQNAIIAVPLVIGAAVCGVYYGACVVAVHGSRLVVRAWAPLPARDRGVRAGAGAAAARERPPTS